MADMVQLQAQMQALSKTYAAQLPEKLRQIDEAWAQLPQAGWDEEGFASLHRMAHSLAGSGKTFGFSLLGDAARALEQYLKQAARGKTELNGAQRKRVHELIQELHRARRRDSAPDSPQEIDVESGANQRKR